MSKKIMRGLFVVVSLMACLVTSKAFARPGGRSVFQKVTDTFIPASPSSVKIEGYLGDRIDSCIDNRVMVQNISRIIKPFRYRFEFDFGGFRCEYWGKWFTSAMLAYSYQPTKAHKAVIEQALDDLLSTQMPDGYIGTYSNQNYLKGWDVWGQKYTLLGLIANYDQTKDKKVLEVACREANLLLRNVGPGKANIATNGIPVLRGLPSTSILEPIVMLYERTGNKKYLNFAKYIVHQWSVPNKFTATGLRLIQKALAGVPPIEITPPKAYEMMSNFEGLLDLYKVTGKKEYLEAVIKFGNSIRKYERMIIGSGSDQELWADGVREQTEVLPQPVETCVTATWMRYCYQLLKVTGNPIWADELEVSLYNALLGAMTPNGDWFAYFSPLIGERVPSLPQHPDVGLSCCVTNGPRGLLLTPRWAVMRSRKGLVVNLYAKGSYAEKLSDGEVVKILQSTDYPVGSEISMTVIPSRTGNFTISLRIPEWSKRNKLSVNGKRIECHPGSYANIERTWKSGDKIILKLDLRGRVIPAPSGAPDLAIMRGPIVLALDSRFIKSQDSLVWLLYGPHGFVSPNSSKKDTANPLTQVNPPGYVRIEPCVSPTDPQQYVTLIPVKSKPDYVWMAFKVPFLVRPSHFFDHHVKDLVMCNYSSAGDEWSDKDLFRVWIPQPLYMGNLYPKNTWKLFNPGVKERPALPKGKFELSAIKNAN